MNKSDLIIQKIDTKEGFNSLQESWISEYDFLLMGKDDICKEMCPAGQKYVQYLYRKSWRS